MQFEVLPILEIMIDFYQKPLSRGRFDEYLRILYDKKSDELLLPLPHFNPMAKDHVLNQLNTLKNLQLEKLMEQAVQELNKALQTFNWPNQTIQFTFSLADDLQGGWTNKYSTDYGNSFQAKGLLTRGFYTCLLWTSETYDATKLNQRIRQSLWRCIYQVKHRFPDTLFQHLAQEAFVQSKVPDIDWEEDPILYELLLGFVQSHQENRDQANLIPFFYGDIAAESLGYLSLGIPEHAGFKLAERLWKEIK